MSKPDQVVMITGAAGALGRAAASAFSRSGASLILLDADDAALRAAYPRPSPDLLLVPADLLIEKQVHAAVEVALAAFGRIDVLCNIAGGFYYGEPVHETRSDIWLQQFSLNATTVVNASKSVVPQMVCQRAGCVLNIGAAEHVRGHAHMSAYAVVKTAVMRLTESMAEELRDSGVAVLCLMPNIIDTPKNRLDMPDLDHHQWTPLSAIADLMVLLSSGAVTRMSGCSIPLTGKTRTVSPDQEYST